MAGRLLPPLALMALLFALSAQGDLSSGLSWDFSLRKAGHMAAYGLLWWLWRRALDGAGGWAAIITIAYAASDEWHQTFTAGRHGAPVDVLIDATGVAIAALLARIAYSQPRSVA